MKIRINKISVIFLAFLFLYSCARSYSGQYFSFPPGSEPHENDWTHLCKIIVWDPFGKRPIERGKRKIQVFIQDKDKNNVLTDKFVLESASIESKVRWEKFERITLYIYEVGNKFAEDDYNKRLIKAGPKHLITLRYLWDGKKYIKNVTEQG